MKYIFIFFSAFFFAQSGNAFGVDLSRIEKQHLENNFEWNINFINQILDHKKYSADREIYFLESYKVAALVQAQEYEEAIYLSEKLLNLPNRPPEMVLKLRIQRSLVFEILSLLDRSTFELRQAELLLEKYPSYRSKYFAEFLIRSSSLNRIKGNKVQFLNFAERAKSFADSVGDYQHRAEAKMLLAFYYREKDPKSPVLLDYYNQSLSSAKRIHTNGLLIAIYLNISSHLLKNSEFDDAIRYTDSADALINKNGDYFSQSMVYKTKSDIFEKKKKFDSALYYFKKFDSARYKLNETGQKIKITELDRRSALEKEVEEKEGIEKILTTTEKFNNQLILLTLVLGIFLAALIFGTYLLNRRRKEILHQKERIKTKNDRLNQLVKQKEFLVQELNHRVKNNLLAIMTLIQLQTDETDVEQHKDDFKKLHERIRTISIGHHLYSYSVSHTDSALIDIKIYTNQILENKKASTALPLEFINETEEILLKVDTILSIGLMLNELISNSEKHAQFPKTENLKIYLALKQYGSQIKMIYNDNGTFFNNNKDEEALGMYIISGMVEQLRGTYERNGSTYIIDFPV